MLPWVDFIPETLLFFITIILLQVYHDLYLPTIFLPDLLRDFNYLSSPYTPNIYNILRNWYNILFSTLTRDAFPSPLLSLCNSKFFICTSPFCTKVYNRNASAFMCFSVCLFWTLSTNLRFGIGFLN